MLQFTYAPTHPRMQRTAPVVVLCVLALHVLAIASLLLSPSTTAMDNQQSIAMEMVLAPVSHTPPKAQTATAHTSKSATAPTAAPNTAALATPSLAPVAATGAPAFSLPSSEAHGLTNPKPAYPRQSRRLNEQGRVVIRVFVAADGSPQQGEIKTSSGFDRLDQEALRTVMRWRFVPGQRFGMPEAMWFNVPVNFVLE